MGFDPLAWLLNPGGRVLEGAGVPIPVEPFQEPWRLPIVGGFFNDPAEKQKLAAMEQAKQQYQTYRPQAEAARLEALRRVLGGFGATNQMVQAMTGFGPPQISTEALFGVPQAQMGAPPMAPGPAPMPPAPSRGYDRGSYLNPSEGKSWIRRGEF